MNLEISGLRLPRPLERMPTSAAPIDPEVTLA